MGQFLGPQGLKWGECGGEESMGGRREGRNRMKKLFLAKIFHFIGSGERESGTVKMVTGGY